MSKFDKHPDTPLPPTLAKLSEKLEQLEHLRSEVLQLLITGQQEFLPENKVINNVDSTDYGFLCKQISEACDELRKEAGQRFDLYGRRFGYQRTKEALAAGGDDDFLMVRARLCSATPRVTEVMSRARPGSEPYAALCRQFKVPEETAALGVVDFNWRRTNEAIEKLVETGKDGFLREHLRLDAHYAATVVKRRK